MKKILVGLLVCSFLFSAGGAVKKDPYWDKMMPQEDIQGKAIIYNKKAYLVDVWATWCPPCRQTIPELVMLQEKYPTKDFTVIGISVDENPAAVYKFMSTNYINYPISLDKEALKSFPPVRGIPTMFLLNKEGQIVKTFIGYTSAKTLSAAIEKELK